jgi:ATP-dependent helicase HrpB
MPLDALPIDGVMPELTATLARSGAAVLVAPAGAGKTTRVPLVLAQQDWAAGRKIVVIEPRRLAARAAAARMAALLQESLGASVGYRVRFDSKVSPATRIEVVTPGIFTRHVLDHPGLDDVAAVLFDEFHERALDGDLGLALAHELRHAVREDLRLLVMSATLDGGRVAKALGDVPLIESSGAAFPVETRYLGRDMRVPIERQVAQAVARAVRSDTGSVLIFLPGAREIRRTEGFVRELISDPAVDIVPLYGALTPAEQDRAIAPPAAPRRKVVLATSIAETSLTIEGVRVVIDSGLARVPRYEPSVDLTRLETVKVSRAAADQRRGRAGRTQPGICYRLWDAAQTASLEPADRPEILAADLSGFVLDLAEWGVGDASSLVFLDPPPQGALRQAKALLNDLGALDADGRITQAGRNLRRLPLPPRLARMVIEGAALGEGLLAAEIALVLTEPGLGDNDVDLTARLAQLRLDGSARGRAARAMARRWSSLVASRPRERRGPEKGHWPKGNKGAASVGSLLALAYPDRIAKNRGVGAAFLLANGRGAGLDAASPLAKEPFLAVAEISGPAAQGRIMLAAPLALPEIEALFAQRIESRDQVSFDAASGSLRGRRLRTLGGIVLAEQPAQVLANEGTARALAEALAQLGLERLPWTESLRQWRERVMFLRGLEGRKWPDLSDDILTRGAAQWLSPTFAGKTALGERSAREFAQALHALLPLDLRGPLETQAPARFTAPSGTSVPIDYSVPEGPTIALRVQELFGLDRHPSIAGGRVALVVELLSPAHRAVQVTRDLPGFWRGSYAAVKSEMKGRYPRHHWPDNPLLAPPGTRAKRRS